MDIALNLRKTSIIFISSDVSQEGWGGGGWGIERKRRHDVTRGEIDM